MHFRHTDYLHPSGVGMLGLGAATSLKGDLHQLKQYRTGSQLAIATTCIAVAELREHNVTNTTLL